MKKANQNNMTAFSAFFLFSVICFFVVSLTITYQSYAKKKELLKNQTELAISMGVSNENYPFFPVDYFIEKIKPGMALEEVHKIIVGYESVYNDDDNFEIYYYFSKDDDIATRIEVMYDIENHYTVLQISGEDENSRTLTVQGWSVGLLTRKIDLSP